MYELVAYKTDSCKYDETLFIHLANLM